MHQPIPKQGQWLKQIVTGYFHYHLCRRIVAHLHGSPASALPLITQGGSRVPESGSHGSVRGALSNGRPYRDQEN
jgi:hypothetical protein